MVFTSARSDPMIQGTDRALTFGPSRSRNPPKFGGIS